MGARARPADGCPDWPDFIDLEGPAERLGVGFGARRLRGAEGVAVAADAGERAFAHL